MRIRSAAALVRRCVLFVALVASAAHCGRKDASDSASRVRYGEAVRIRVEDAKLPPYELVVAANEGERPDGLVESLTSAVHGALVECPAGSLIGAKPREPLTFAFQVDDQGLHDGRPALGTSPADACVLDHLNGKRLSGSGKLPSHLLVQVRFAPENEGAARNDSDARP